MKSELESGASDKLNWFKNHMLSEEQRKKLIEDKVKRIINQLELNRKARVVNTV